MPTYSYQCTKCGHTFELFHSINDDSPKKCEKCGKPAKRLIGAGAGLVFKGSGFYETDYKHSNGKVTGANGNGHHEKSTPEKTEKASSGGDS